MGMRLDVVMRMGKGWREGFTAEQLARTRISFVWVEGM